MAVAVCLLGLQMPECVYRIADLHWTSAPLLMFVKHPHTLCVGSPHVTCTRLGVTDVTSH